MSETPKSWTREEIVSGTVRQLRTLISTFGDDRGYYVEEISRYEPDAQFVIKTVWGTEAERDKRKPKEPIGEIALQGLPHSRVLVTMRAGWTYKESRRAHALLVLPYDDGEFVKHVPPPTKEQIESFKDFCNRLIIYLTQLGAIVDEVGQKAAVRPGTGVKPHEVQQSILQVIAGVQKSHNQFVADTQIAERLGLDVRDIQMHLDLMEEEGYVNLAKSFRGYGALVTSRGRMMLQEPDYFQREASAQVIHIIDSHIQNLAQTGADAVVNQSASSGLDDDILKIIDQMVEMVHSSDDIEPVIKQDYELEAEGLKTELRKSRLNLSRIREMFAFLGDIEDNLGLATRLAPYLITLGPHIERLIHQT
jgi:predicted ArsR family transcriptional regulator